MPMAPNSLKLKGKVPAVGSELYDLSPLCLWHSQPLSALFISTTDDVFLSVFRVKDMCDPTFQPFYEPFLFLEWSILNTQVAKAPPPSF